MSSPSDDEDVKALLGRALAGEPPLTLDRDEVFRQGRRKLRNRRMFSTGGAIAGVVVAAVGAVLLTGLIPEEPESELPPAATRTDHAPPGPTLPLTTTPQGPPTTVAPLSDKQAVTMSVALLDLGVLPDDVELSPPDGGPVRFTPAEDTYELRTDVKRQSAQGSLSVSVGAADPDVGADCAQLDDANAGCEVRKERGVAVAVGTWKDHATGEKRYIAFAVREDGTSVTAIATNLSERQRKYGKQPADRTPIIDEATLAKVVTLPELRFAY